MIRSRPNVLEKLIVAGLVDYLAMDIKGPLEKYHCVTKSGKAWRNIFPVC